MNLDDLVAVWRSQDVAPLHGVNEALVRLALRQDQAKLQKWRRLEKWLVYLIGAAMIGGLARRLAIMINRDDDVLSGWDYAIPVVGAAAALLWVGMMRVRHRALHYPREWDKSERIRRTNIG